MSVTVGNLKGNYRANSSKNSKFTMLGMQHSGKTCYVAGMYMKMAIGVNGFTLVAEDETRTKLEREIRALRQPSGKNRFPDPTAANIDAVKKYEFRMCHDLKEIVSFEMEDYSGNSLTMRDVVYQNIKNSVAESTVLYIFIDGESFKADSREERKENVYYDSAMTLCPMIQDFADAHSGMMPPIVFVVTKADLCKKYVIEDEIISVIKELFRPAFSQDTMTYISAISLGENISDDNYRGKLSPFNIHIPFFIGCYHEYYNRFAVLQNNIAVANGSWRTTAINMEDYLMKEKRKWKIFRNPSLIADYQERIFNAKNGIQQNQKLLQDAEKMLIRFGTHLEHESDERNFYYFKNGRQMEFRDSDVRRN